jgi:WD40 repeat protein
VTTRPGAAVRPPVVVRGAILAVLSLALTAGPAAAGDLLQLGPGTAYHVEWWQPGSKQELQIQFVVRQNRLVTLDHVMQVAPGGGALVGSDGSSRLVLFSSSGAELWHHNGRVSAFRFSPSGADLAVATDKAIEIFRLAERRMRILVDLPGVPWLRWINGGLLARKDNQLYVVDDGGNKRALVSLPKRAVVAASRGRLIYFARSTLVDIDLSTGQTRSATKLAEHAAIVDAELSPDGSRVLFATAKRVYLIDGQSPLKKVADVDRLQSLHFSPDGSSFVWASWSSGALVTQGKTTPLPDDAIAARYRQDGGAELVVTLVRDGVGLWNPTTGKWTPTGGFSRAEGKTLAGDFAGGSSLFLFTPRASSVKEKMMPDYDREDDKAVSF